MIGGDRRQHGDRARNGGSPSDNHLGLSAPTADASTGAWGAHATDLYGPQIHLAGRSSAFRRGHGSSMAERGADRGNTVNAGARGVEVRVRRGFRGAAP